MISLFNLPKTKLDLSTFDHILHGEDVTRLENTIKEYVNGSYACAINSCTTAIFLVLSYYKCEAKIPAMIPPVVLNAAIQSQVHIKLVDNTSWVGKTYTLAENPKIIDSAQSIQENQSTGETILYSFYPTKPIGGIDGGMIVSEDKDMIDWCKCAVMNGMSLSTNSWERIPKFAGWKAYMNTAQAKVALDSFSKLEDKNKRLAEIRAIYNNEFGINNESIHLYTILSNNRKKLIEELSKNDMQYGIHYQCTHNYEPYSTLKKTDISLSKSHSLKTLSLPYNENLTDEEVLRVIKVVKNAEENN